MTKYILTDDELSDCINTLYMHGEINYTYDMASIDTRLLMRDLISDYDGVTFTYDNKQYYVVDTDSDY